MQVSNTIRLRNFIARNPDRLLAFALALGAFALYVRTLAPGVLDGDSGEWQYMANILGVPHSTGYPLYILLAKLFTLVPVGNPAWRVNLFSAACAAATVAVVYLLAQRLSHSRPAAAIAAALFAAAPTLWASAVQAEVYALNTLLLALTFYFAVRWYDWSQPEDLYAMAFVFGLALTNHRIAAFITPGLLLLGWVMRRTLDVPRVVIAALLLLAPLSLYLYIPLRASQLLATQAPENWALYPRAEAFLRGTVSAYYNHSLYGFFNLITGFDNRNKLGFQESGGAGSFLSRSGDGASLLLQQFGPIGIVLALAGGVWLWKRERGLTAVLLGAAAGIAGISILLRAESTRFYFSGAYLVLALFIAAGINALTARFRNRPRARDALGAFFALLPLAALWFNFPQMDASHNTAHDRWARFVLQDNLAPNAVVVAPWEIVTPLRYFQMVEGQHPDLLFVHESPVRPQFQKLLASAHAVKRPFYYVQFTPEERTASEPRTVQAIPLPLWNVLQPRYAVNQRLTDAVRVLGFELRPEPPRAGELVRVAVYYQVVAPTKVQYSAELTLADANGRAYETINRAPVAEWAPTYLWQADEYYRDVWDLPVPAAAPRGLYALRLTWYPYGTSRDDGRALVLGPISVITEP